MIRLAVAQSGRLLVPSNNDTEDCYMNLLFRKGFSAARDAIWLLLMYSVPSFKTVVFSNTAADFLSHSQLL